MAFLMLAMAGLVHSLSISVNDPPTSDEYWILGGSVEGNITFNITSTVVEAGNATINCSLWTNETGSWSITATNNTVSALDSTAHYFFSTDTLASKLDTRNVSDDQVFVYAFNCYDNSSSYWNTNRTIHVDDAPTITQSNPSDSGTSTSADITLNISIVGDGDTYTCYTYSNDTGSFGQDGAFTTLSNNTATQYTRVFSAGSVLWNLQCFERTPGFDKYPFVYGWGSNYTLTVDTGTPSVTINAHDDNAYLNANSNNINITVDDSNPSACDLYINDTLNITDTSITDDTANLINWNASDGNYEWYVTCNDTSGNSASTTARTATVDTLFPQISSFANSTAAGTCVAWNEQITFNEDVNVTIHYSTTSGTDYGYTFINNSFDTTHNTLITFNNSYETTHYMNVTFYDRAGNFNYTAAQLTLSSPAPMCTGWSLYTLYDTSINLSDLYTDSGVDYVYWWNDTGQSWKYHSDATTTWGDQVLGIGEVVFFYEADNRTYFRNKTGTPSYRVNLTGGHNWIGLFGSEDFGNISYYQFKNQTLGNKTSATEFKIEFLSAWNNSGKRYVNTIFEWSINNATAVLGATGLDTLWLWSDYNLTVNITPGNDGTGGVYGTWS